MIRTEDGELVATCDDCGETAYGGTREFKPFLDDLKSQGWTARKVEDRWTHRCPECNDAR